MVKEQLTNKAHSLISEFRNFALKGNAFELAIAVVVGGAFGKIVSSLVADILTPLLAFMTGGADFKHLSLTLREGVGDAPAVVISYGAFLQTIFDFFFIALSIFFVFKLIATARRRLFAEEKADGVPAHEKPAQERLLEEIRDLLKNKS